ncbi:MAG TPA: nucleotidyltransferase family protein [Acidimicrobiales bacterium]
MFRARSALRTSLDGPGDGPVNGTGLGLPQLAAVLTLHIDQVTAEVVAAFDRAGVEAILLKGPSIARWLYPEGGRAYGDTDLLVPAALFGRAVGVLESLGFTGLMDRVAPWERNETAVERAFVRRRSDGHREVVDLHRNLSGIAASDELLWEVFRGGCETIVLAGRDVWVLDETGLALHVALHALQHLYQDQPDHVAEDLRRAIQTLPFPGWQRVAELARRLGIEGRLAAGLRALPEGAEVAERLGFPDRRRDGPLWWYSASPRGVVSLVGFWSASNWSGRARWVRRTMFPSPMKVRYMLSSPDATGATLASLYVRHWQRVAASFGPALRFVVRNRREILSRARPFARSGRWRNRGHDGRLTYPTTSGGGRRRRSRKSSSCGS